MSLEHVMFKTKWNKNSFMLIKKYVIRSCGCLATFRYLASWKRQLSGYSFLMIHGSLEPAKTDARILTVFMIAIFSFPFIVWPHFHFPKSKVYIAVPHTRMHLNSQWHPHRRSIASVSNDIQTCAFPSAKLLSIYVFTYLYSDESRLCGQRATILSGEYPLWLP